MECKEFIVKNYHLSYITGCMIEEPLSVLPAYFEPWNRLAKSVSDLIKQRQLRDEVHKLPLLDHTELKGYRQWRLAHLQLAFITAGYVWQDGDKGAVNVLPRSVAVPFHYISKELGVHPILSHMDLVLSNYKLADPYGPLDLSNIDCWYCLPGGEQGKWFVTVTMLVELEFTSCLKSLEKTVNLVQESKTGKEELWQYYNMKDIIGHLDDICKCIGNMKEALSRMHDRLPAKTFFNVLRPFLGGWGGEGNILPEGLIYEGISDEPVQLAGGSAAQSTSLQALDAFLGICHTGERREFLVKMRESMPSDHVRFIQDLEQMSHLSTYVEEMAVPALTKAYNKCIDALTNFRSYHISIVSKYIISAAKNANEGNYQSLDEKGTGGTDLIPFLKGILHNTNEKFVKSSLMENNHEKKGNLGETQEKGNTYFFLGLAVLGAFVVMLSKKVLK